MNKNKIFGASDGIYQYNHLLDTKDWRDMSTAPSYKNIYLKCQVVENGSYVDYVCVGRVNSEKKVRLSSSADADIFFRSSLLGWKPCPPRNLQEVIETAHQSFDSLYHRYGIKPNAWVMSQDLVEILKEATPVLHYPSNCEIASDTIELMGLPVHLVYNEKGLVKATIEEE